jgi:AcrR family transcriptional regulator
MTPARPATEAGATGNTGNTVDSGVTGVTGVTGATEVATPPRRPGRPRDARADQVILDAAAQVLAEQGPAGFTIDAVAARASCGKATIYRRWRSRAELLLETAELAAVEVSFPDTGSVREDLVTLLGGLARKMRDTAAGQLLPAVLAEAAVNPEMRETFAQFAHERRSRCYNVIVRGMERGQLRPDIDPDVVTDMLGGPIFMRVLFGHLPIDDGLVERAVDTVLEDLRAEGTSSP